MQKMLFDTWMEPEFVEPVSKWKCQLGVLVILAVVVVVAEAVEEAMAVVAVTMVVVVVDSEGAGETVGMVVAMGPDDDDLVRVHHAVDQFHGVTHGLEVVLVAHGVLARHQLKTTALSSSI